MAKITLKRFLEERGVLEHYVRGRLSVPEYHNACKLSPDDPFHWILFAFDWGWNKSPRGVSWTSINAEWGDLVASRKVAADPGFPIFDTLGLRILFPDIPVDEWDG